jgi:hypothetical protein
MSEPRIESDCGSLQPRAASSSRTRFRTEAWWLLGVLLLGAVVPVVAVLWFVWLIIQAGAGC